MVDLLVGPLEVLLGVLLEFLPEGLLEQLVVVLLAGLLEVVR